MSLLAVWAWNGDRFASLPEKTDFLGGFLKRLLTKSVNKQTYSAISKLAVNGSCVLNVSTSHFFKFQVETLCDHLRNSRIKAQIPAMHSGINTGSLWMEGMQIMFVSLQWSHTGDVQEVIQKMLVVVVMVHKLSKFCSDTSPFIHLRAGLGKLIF